jgi:hypothetical protein
MLHIDRLIVNQIRPPLCLPAMARKNPAAVALGKIKTAKKSAASAKNARKATAARMKLTEEQRSAIARKAAETRWGKKKH